MGTAKQLYQLQEVDLEIESYEQALSQKADQLGERQALDNAQSKLASEQQQLEELRHQQHSAEWEVDDILSKITAAEQQLYGGKITNPKELSSLQHEVTTMKSKSDNLENKALEIIDRVEEAEKSVAAATSELKKLDSEWQKQQQQLSTEIDQIKSKLSDLNHKRQQASAEIEPQAVESYERVRKQKKQAVAKVEQGICRGCRISLSSSELQQVRSGNLVHCGSCGRILFLP
ncbi:zinc ribbon domain-containing protein [Chloroflexota bacterium]